MDYRVTIDHLDIDYSNTSTTTSFDADVFYQDFTVSQETLPVSIFSQSLSSLQAIVKYLKETKELSFSEIARLLNRDPRTIWATYDSVKDEKLEDISSETLIPLGIFSDRNLSTLEALTQHLLDSGLSVSKIAALLGKNYQTIWTVKSRIKAKGGGAR